MHTAMSERATSTGVSSSPPRKDSPFVIAAFLGHQTLGDFVMYNLVAASFARAIPNSRLVVLYRDDRPYKTLITRCNPFADKILRVPQGSDHVFPLDWFDGQPNVPDRPFDDSWLEEGLHRPDLFLVPAMIDISCAHPPLPRFRVPDELEPNLKNALVRAGVMPGRWFACIHMREDDYQYRKGMAVTARSVDPQSYLPMIKHIVESQGGQVVRLGDPSMSHLPDMEGVIDLARIGDSFPTQFFAISRARYFIASDSGPTQLGSAFGTPTVTTNSVTPTVWNDGDAVLLKSFIGPSGQEVPFAELRDAGILTVHHNRPDTLDVVDNSPDDLLRAAEHMYERTRDCSGWREEAGQPPPTRKGSISLPAKWRDILDMGQITVLEPKEART